MKKPALIFHAWSDNCEHSNVSINRFFDCWTTIIKFINIALIEDVDNPLYKAKLARTGLAYWG